MNIVGEFFKNRGGGLYKIIDRVGENDYWVTNYLSGWTCIAHNLHVYEDGTIDWDYSSRGRFE